MTHAGVPGGDGAVPYARDGATCDARDAVIWMRPEVTGRGRARAHSRDQIARAAIAIADTRGIDAVTMRRVAEDIGAGTMTLYRYVRGKDELHALMIDSLVNLDQLDAIPADWREALRMLGMSMRQVVLRHPWYPAVQACVAGFSPNALAAMEKMLSRLDGLGLSIDEMLEVVLIIMNFAMGSAQDEVAENQALRRSGKTKEQWQAMHGPYLQWLLDSGEFPQLRRLIKDAADPHDSTDAVYRRTLDRLIDGLAVTIEAGRA